MTEQVVLLDEDGNAIGTADKAEVHGQDTPLHLAFSVYVFDADGRFLLTQRALEKPTFGGVWTNSCCGHPAPGEPVDAAVLRRTEQELGHELEKLVLVLPAFRYRAAVEDGPFAGTVENEMCPVYVATVAEGAGDPRPAPTEVEAWEWVGWPRFRDDVLAGRRAVSQWCREQVAALPEDPRSAAAASNAQLPPAARAVI